MRCSYKFLFEGIGISNNNLGQKLIMNVEDRRSKTEFNDTQDFLFIVCFQYKNLERDILSM